MELENVAVGFLLRGGGHPPRKRWSVGRVPMIGEEVELEGSVLTVTAVRWEAGVARLAEGEPLLWAVVVLDG